MSYIHRSCHWAEVKYTRYCQSQQLAEEQPLRNGLGKSQAVVDDGNQAVDDLNGSRLVSQRHIHPQHLIGVSMSHLVSGIVTFNTYHSLIIHAHFPSLFELSGSMKSYPMLPTHITPEHSPLLHAQDLPDGRRFVARFLSGT